MCEYCVCPCVLSFAHRTCNKVRLSVISAVRRSAQYLCSSVGITLPPPPPRACPPACPRRSPLTQLPLSGLTRAVVYLQGIVFDSVPPAPTFSSTSPSSSWRVVAIPPGAATGRYQSIKSFQRHHPFVYQINQSPPLLFRIQPIFENWSKGGGSISRHITRINHPTPRLDVF